MCKTNETLFEIFAYIFSWFRVFYLLRTSDVLLDVLMEFVVIVEEWNYQKIDMLNRCQWFSWYFWLWCSFFSTIKSLCRQASFVKPLMAEQIRHKSCVGNGGNWIHAVQVRMWLDTTFTLTTRLRGAVKSLCIISCDWLKWCCLFEVSIIFLASVLFTDALQKKAYFSSSVSISSFICRENLPVLDLMLCSVIFSFLRTSISTLEWSYQASYNVIIIILNQFQFFTLIFFFDKFWLAKHIFFFLFNSYLKSQEVEYIYPYFF